MKTDHILIMRFSAIGDVAMTVPVVYSLARQYPNLRITVLSRPFARPFFDGLAPNVSFMEADIKMEYHGVKGLNALYRRLQAKQFTHVADLHNVLRSNYLRMRFNVRRYRVAHINKHRKGKRRLTSSVDRQLVQLPTSFENYADVLAQLGYPVELDFCSIFPPEGGDLRLLPAVIGTKRADELWIGIAPFAAHKGKIYPTDKMERVIEELHKRHPNARVMLFGGGGEERQLLEQWCARHDYCTNVSAHSAGLMQELIAMSHLDVMVSMDSANMHLASLVGTTVVSVWGATHPYAGFLGWNQSLDNAVQQEMECRPCSIYGNKPCMRGDYACLNGIAPELIVERVDSVISKSGESTK